MSRCHKYSGQFKICIKADDVIVDVHRSGAATSGVEGSRGKTPVIPEVEEEEGLDGRDHRHGGDRGGGGGFDSFKEDLLDGVHDKTSTLKRDLVADEKHASAEERITEKSATIVHQVHKIRLDFWVIF